MSVMRVLTRTHALSKMELFVMIVKRWKTFRIVTNSFIIDVAGVLEPVWVV